jgi:peroxiredoxin
MTPGHALRVGDAAPDFEVDAINGEGTIALAQYRGRQPFFIGLYRGLHCPFCRRNLAQLDLVRRKLEPFGIDTVAIVNTPLDRARLYFRNVRTGVRLGADPDARAHRAWTVPEIEIVEPGARREPWPIQITLDEFLSHRINPTGEMPAPVSPLESNDILNARDGFEMTPADAAIRERHGTLLVGQFIVDRDGAIRWRYVEGEATPAELGRFPTPQQIVDAAAALAV